MTSRKVETVHDDTIKNLFDDVGMICHRPLLEESDSTLLFEEYEVVEKEEVRSEAVEGEYEEDHMKIPPEILTEEQIEEPLDFPTPSLRLMLPDKVRDMQKHNRIHVLPDTFNTQIDPEDIPRIAVTAPKVYIDKLALITGCKQYQINLAEYWFLDTLANLVRRSQADNMIPTSQAMVILWFCEWMNEIQYFDAADRNRMLKRFKDNMLRVSRYVAVEEQVPSPSVVGISHTQNPPEDRRYLPTKLKLRNNSPSTHAPLRPKSTRGSKTSSLRSISKITSGMSSTKNLSKSAPPTKSSKANRPSTESQEPAVTLEESFMCSLHDITQIFHYIYDLFSTDYQYDLIRSVFTFSPDYTLVDAPYQIVTPKQMFAMPKPEKPSKSDSKAGKDKKAKHVEQEPLPEDYIALMELKAKEEKELEELAAKQQLEWLKKSSILPLTLAGTQDLFDYYWPPPPPSPPPEPKETKDKKSTKRKPSP